MINTKFLINFMTFAFLLRTIKSVCVPDNAVFCTDVHYDVVSNNADKAALLMQFPVDFVGVKYNHDDLEVKTLEYTL
jgi:hypothetical protein